MLEPGKSLRLMLMPSGSDPDDVLRQHGKEAFATMISNSISLIDGIMGRAGRRA